MNRSGFLALALLLLWPAQAFGEWQLKPFLGLTFAGSTTLQVDLEQAVDDPNLDFGASALLLGELVGVEADFGFAPGFFQSGNRQLVAQSSVLTLTGNIVVALPKRVARYTLRPYLVGGLGLMRIHVDDDLGELQLTSNYATLDAGGGVTGFVTRHVGVSWDLRYFRNISGKDERQGLSLGDPRLSFWRASMAVVVR